MTTKETPVTDFPKIRVGKLDGVWVAAVRDQLGWVQLGTGEDVDEHVDGWAPVAPVQPPTVSGSDLERAAIAMYEDDRRAAGEQIGWESLSLPVQNRYLARVRAAFQSLLGEA